LALPDIKILLISANMNRVLITLCLAAIGAFSPALAQWPSPTAPVIPKADGYIAIPNAVLPPKKENVYRAIFNATQAADKPTELIPALNMVGSELNALSAAGAPLANAKFVVVFHGAALDGILNDASYKAKFAAANPNLEVLAQLKKAGTQLFVCGQNVAAAKIDPKTISPDVALASDALIVLMKYQNDGYALMSF
jgi:intracellular sulfur oxidation DsrE/DsrF family protein